MKKVFLISLVGFIFTSNLALAQFGSINMTPYGIQAPTSPTQYPIPSHPGSHPAPFPPPSFAGCENSGQQNFYGENGTSESGYNNTSPGHSASGYSKGTYSSFGASMSYNNKCGIYY